MFWYHESARGFPEVDGHLEKTDALSAAARTSGSSEGRSDASCSRRAGEKEALSFFHAAARYCTAAIRASLPESESERAYDARTAGTSAARACPARFPSTVARA